MEGDDKGDRRMRSKGYPAIITADADQHHLSPSPGLPKRPPELVQALKAELIPDSSSALSAPLLLTRSLTCSTREP